MTIPEEKKRKIFNRVFRHTDDGKNILDEINQFCGFSETGYVENSDRTVFNAGRRSVAVWLSHMSRESRGELPLEQQSETKRKARQ